MLGFWFVLSLGLARPVAGDRGGVVHVLYFYSTSCEHCKIVEEEVLPPLREKYGEQLDVRMLEIGTPQNYELLIQAEEQYGVSAEERGLPTLIVGDEVLIGEEAARERLDTLIAEGIAKGGVSLPDLPGLDAVMASPAVPSPFGDEGEVGVCTAEEESSDACGTAEPIWAAYFYQVGCKACSRAEADIQYIRSRYPQFTVREFNIYDDAALAQWMAERVGRAADLHAPAIFVGNEALIGDGEITPQNLERLIQKYEATGAPKVWEEFDPEQVEQSLVERFKRFGPMTVILAGLVDGLNPCAFATLIFFISYLTLSGRKGREVLMVGIAFTLGVFVAYLLIGLGFYKVLDVMKETLEMLSRWVDGLTALFCAVLAFYSFLDFLKARRGEIEDMSLKLPHSLRLRINAVIRKGRRARAFVAGAFVTGVVISFLELACTGQVYLPTIIFVTSIPEMRARAIAYLLLYNVLFTLPLVVVFVLAYYGTTSRDLTRFLQRNAAAVKLGMVVFFTSLSVWLGVSLLS